MGIAMTPSILRMPPDPIYTEFDPRSWGSVRSQFLLNHDNIQMAQMLFASHPKQVRDAIESHRKAFDESPAEYWEELGFTQEPMICEVAAEYMGVQPEEIVLTDSTTQGLSLLFNGLKLKPGDVILSTKHDHYVTDKAIEYACEKKGSQNIQIPEYDDPALVTVDEVVSKIRQAITPETRILATTWVHSCTGVKLPIRDIAAMLEEVNNRRNDEDRIYFCVDGVHGFGNQDHDISALGCDFFAAGTHKWICGPRGTGILWGKKNAWHMIQPTVPPFKLYPYMEWMGQAPNREATLSEMLTPGGFHAYDHLWALDEGFKFQMEIGRDRIHQRIRDLNSRLKDGISKIPGLKLYTPMSPQLSAGINCFEMPGVSAAEMVEKLHGEKIIASSSPYRISYARLTPSIINTEEEVDYCIKALKSICS